MKRDRLAAVAAALAAAVALGALALSIAAVRQLKAQSRIDLAMSLQRQFDNDYKQDRADCARAYLYGGESGKRKKKGLEACPYRYVMDFFDTVGYLVERGAADEELARYYLGYPLDGYFQATQPFLRKDQRKNPRRYANAFKLVERWHEEDARPNLTDFFNDELDFAEPPPPDEGPRT